MEETSTYDDPFWLSQRKTRARRCVSHSPTAAAANVVFYPNGYDIPAFSCAYSVDSLETATLESFPKAKGATATW